jgi:hypothetical protein
MKMSYNTPRLGNLYRMSGMRNFGKQNFIAPAALDTAAGAIVSLLLQLQWLLHILCKGIPMSIGKHNA